MSLVLKKVLESDIVLYKEVNLYADLATIASPTNGQKAIVLSDTNYTNQKTLYMYNGTTWVFQSLLKDLDHKLLFSKDRNIYLTNANKQPIKMGDILPYIDYASLISANPAIPNKLYMTLKGQLYYYNTTTSSYKLISGGGGSGGSSLLGTVATKALVATTYPNPDDYNSVIVTADENYSGQTTWYLWLNNTWNYQGIYFPETLEISVSEKNTRADIIAPNADYTIPIGYLVDKGHLSIYLEGELLLKGPDYIEVGTSTYKSTKIQFKFTVPKEARLVFIRNVASYSGDSMITRLTSEVFLKYANDSWSGLNALVSSLGFDNLTKSTNVVTTSAAVIKTVPSNCKVGTRLLYRKVDSSTNNVTINMPDGETVTRANLTSLTLTSCDDFWEIEKVTLTRWVLRDGLESGTKTDSTGTQKFYRYFDGNQVCSGRLKDTTAAVICSFAIGTQGWSFYSQTLIITFIKPFVDIPECFGSAGTLSTTDETRGGLASVEGATMTQLQISSWSQDTNNRMKVYSAKGRWYA